MGGLVLVTGGAGFIGSNIVAELVAAGREVAVCDRFRDAESGKWRNLRKHAVADIVEPERLADWLAAEGSALSAAYHMGAISATTEPDVDLIVRTNLLLSRLVWDACAKNGVPLVYASSAATYGAGERGFKDDDALAALTALRPLNAYGWSKALFDIWARRAADRGFAPPRWFGLKFFNVYGPNEYHKGRMRSLVHQVWPRVKTGAPVTLFRSHNPAYPDGGQLRDFVYVKDAAKAAVWLEVAPAAPSGLYNIGTGRAQSFRELVDATFAAAGRTSLVEFVDTPEDIRPNYQYFTEADMTKLRQAGYNADVMDVAAGVKDYVTGYLTASDPYR